MPHCYFIAHTSFSHLYKMLVIMTRAKVIWQKATSRDPNFQKGEVVSDSTNRKSDNAVLSCRFYVVTTALCYLSRHHSVAICHRISPTLKSTWIGSLWGKCGEEGLTDVSQILTRSGRDTGLLYAIKIVSISSAV